MPLDSEILADLHQLLSEHGVPARWNGIDLLVLISRIRRDQQIDLGGFVDSPDLSMRVPKNAFPGDLPKFAVANPRNPLRVKEVGREGFEPSYTYVIRFTV